MINDSKIICLLIYYLTLIIIYNYIIKKELFKNYNYILIIHVSFFNEMKLNVLLEINKKKKIIRYSKYHLLPFISINQLIEDEPILNFKCLNDQIKENNHRAFLMNQMLGTLVVYIEQKMNIQKKKMN